MHVFWTKGYSDASTADLTHAMGISAPSLYAAFGSKENLFREAVELYDSKEGGRALEALHEEKACKEAVRAMLREYVNVFTSFPERRGCLMILGTVTVPNANSELQDIFRQKRLGAQKKIAARLRKAVREGELDAHADVAAIAHLCLTVGNGLTVQILDGVARPALFRSIDLFVDTLGFTS